MRRPAARLLAALFFLLALLLGEPEGRAQEGEDSRKGWSLHGVVWLDFTQAQGDLFGVNPSLGLSGAQADQNRGLADGFHLTRAYLTVLRRFDSGFLFQITTDQMTLRPDGAGEATPFGLSGYSKAGRGNLFVKYASLEGPILPGLRFKAGLQQPPWIHFDDQAWTLRFTRPTFWNEQGVLHSAELGISLIGETAEGTAHYNLFFSEGESYQDTAMDGRGFALAGEADLNVGPWTLAGLVRAETVRNGVSGWNPNSQIVALVYSRPLFRLSGQFLFADDGPISPILMTTYDSASGSKGPSTSGPRLHEARGYGFWGYALIPGAEAIKVFARYYALTPNRDTEAGRFDEGQVGVAYRWNPSVTLALDDVQIWTRLLRTSDGSIQKVTSNVVGLRAELAF